VRLGISGRRLNFSDESLKKFDNYFKNNDIKKLYTGIGFYSNTINMNNRVGNYTRRIFELETERLDLSKSINNYLKTLVEN
jgi:hypothetical protein